MSKKLVAYFSASGVTAKVAEELSEAIGANLYAIEPEVPYTREDLNWQNKASRSSLEMNDKASRPAIADKDADIQNYDVVFVGFPIWWYVAPTIINNFFQAYDSSGKKIVLFATTGGSGFGKTVEGLKPSVSATAEIIEGKILNGQQTYEGLTAWVDSLGL